MNAERVESLFDGVQEAFISEIRNLKYVLVKEFDASEKLKELYEKSELKKRQLAEENDVYQWVPDIPVHMRYCTEDEEVFYSNALVAESWMNENGAEDVIAYNVGDVNHNDCALSAITNSMLWFYSLNNNNATGVFENQLASSSCKLYDLYGRLVYEGDEDKLPALTGIHILQSSNRIQKVFMTQ